MVSSAIRYYPLYLAMEIGLFGEGGTRPEQAAQHGAVVQVTADLHAEPTEDLGVDGHPYGDLSTVPLGQCPAQPRFFVLGQWDRRGDVRHGPVAGLGGQLDQPRQRGAEAAAAEPGQGQPDQRHGDPARLPVQQVPDQRGPLPDRGTGVAERPRQLRRPVGDLREAEQLVLDLAEFPGPLGAGQQGVHAQPLRRVAQRARARPARPDQLLDQPERLVLDLAAKYIAGQLGPVIGAPRRVGQRPAQPGLPAEQGGDRQQLVREGGQGLRGRSGRVRREPVRSRPVRLAHPGFHSGIPPGSPRAQRPRNVRDLDRPRRCVCRSPAMTREPYQPAGGAGDSTPAAPAPAGVATFVGPSVSGGPTRYSGRRPGRDQTSNRYRGYAGNFVTNVFTSSARSASSGVPGWARTARLISSATWRICGSRIPWVVTLGVPTRMPEAMVGLSGSYGMAFLFRVIRAASQRSSASRPVMPNSRRSIRARWVSVPPDTGRIPCAANPCASARALATTWWAYRW